MSRPWLEIQRESGVEKRRVRAERGAPTATADGECPGCKASPFLIAGHGAHRMPDDRTLKAGMRCVACGDPVGWCYWRPDTVFGLEEDERVLNGRPRVY